MRINWRLLHETSTAFLFLFGTLPMYAIGVIVLESAVRGEVVSLPLLNMLVSF